MTVTVIGEELRHFWQGFFEWMPVPRGHSCLGKHVKIGAQDTASSNFVELFQKRNSHFHSGQMLSAALARREAGAGWSLAYDRDCYRRGAAPFLAGVF